MAEIFQLPNLNERLEQQLPVASEILEVAENIIDMRPGTPPELPIDLELDTARSFLTQARAAVPKQTGSEDVFPHDLGWSFASRGEGSLTLGQIKAYSILNGRYEQHAKGVYLFNDDHVVASLGRVMTTVPPSRKQQHADPTAPYRKKPILFMSNLGSMSSINSVLEGLTDWRTQIIHDAQADRLIREAAVRAQQNDPNAMAKKVRRLQIVR